MKRLKAKGLYALLLRICVSIFAIKILAKATAILETQILSKSTYRPFAFNSSLYNVTIDHHPTIKFTAETSETETTFLDTNVYKGDRFKTA